MPNGRTANTGRKEGALLVDAYPRIHECLGERS
jgi:hypothetical protein